MTRTYHICLLPGDGIGPEIIAEGVKVLDAVGAKYDTAFSYTEALLGGCAIDACGTALPDETLRVAESSDAVLLAAVGGPKWDTTDPAKPRPEQGLLGIRKALGLYTNLRPVQIFAALADASTLKPEIVDGVDMMIVRELTGGLYFGRRERFYDNASALSGRVPAMDGGRKKVRALSRKPACATRKARRPRRLVAHARVRSRHASARRRLAAHDVCDMRDRIRAASMKHVFSRCFSRCRSFRRHAAHASRTRHRARAAIAIANGIRRLREFFCIGLLTVEKTVIRFRPADVPYGSE